MSKKGLIMLMLLAGLSPLISQSVKRNLLSANSICFKQNIYVYGYQEQNNALVFRCFSYSKTLQIKDSANFDLGKHSAADFLEIGIDTLHNVLNFYFQLADQKNNVTLFRLNDRLQKLCVSENYDANHVSSLTAFGNETYVYGEAIYVLKSYHYIDTLGEQIYINKYHVKDLTQPFTHISEWQFPFERNYIRTAAMMYADSNYLLVYANVIDGAKKGQWILRINAKTGTLIKGTKLSGKGDSRYFLLSNLIFNKQSNSIDVIGSIYDADMIDFSNKSSNFINLSKRHKLFLIIIDSTGMVQSRTEKLFPLPLQTNASGHLQSYHIKVREFKKTADKGFDVWTDVYEMTKPNTLCYYSSWHIDMTPDDVDYAFNPSKFSIATKAIPGFVSFAKGDSYGKFELVSIDNYDRFKYEQPKKQVIIKTGIDDFKNAYYVLKRTDILSSSTTYNSIFTGKKGLEKQVVLKSEQGQKGTLYFTTDKTYISFTTNTANSEFELKLNQL